MANAIIQRRNRVATIMFVAASIFISAWQVLVVIAMIYRQTAWGLSVLELYRYICVGNAVVVSAGSVAIAAIVASFAIGGSAISRNRSGSILYYTTCLFIIVGLIASGLMALGLNYADVLASISDFACDSEDSLPCNQIAAAQGTTNLAGISGWLGASLATLLMVNPVQSSEKSTLFLAMKRLFSGRAA